MGRSNTVLAREPRLMLTTDVTLRVCDAPRYLSHTAEQARHFTFVREPLSHFISGYTESKWGTWSTCCEPATRHDGREKCRRRLSRRRARRLADLASSEISPRCPDHARGGIALAHEFVQALLDANEQLLMSARHIGWGPDHVTLMAPNLAIFGCRLQFVGRIEHMKRDWNRLAAWTNGSVPPYSELDQTSGRHVTSKDPHGDKQAMHALLSQNQSLREAVQILLAPDYDCFGSYARRQRHHRSSPSSTLRRWGEHALKR